MQVLSVGLVWLASCSALSMGRSIRSVEDVVKPLAVVAPKVVVSHVEGERGLEASEALKRGEVAIRMNRAEALEVRDGESRLSSRVKDVSRSTLRSLDWEGKLAAELLALRDDKTYENWLEALPESYVELPVFWSPEEVASIRYEPVETAVEKQRESWGKTAPLLAAAFKVSEDEAMRALATVRTRSFSGPLEATGSFQRRAGIVAFAAWLAVGYVGLDMGTVDQATQGFALAVLSSLFADILTSQKVFSSSFKDEDDEIVLKRHVLAPGLDFANHRSQDTSEVSLSYFSDAIALTSDLDLNKGDALCTTYGQKSNAQLLLNYGFVEDDNPNDDYVFPRTIDTELLRGQRVTRRGFAPDTATKALEANGGDNTKAAKVLADACDAQAATLEDDSHEHRRKKTPANTLLANLKKEHASLLRDLAKTTRSSVNYL